MIANFIITLFGIFLVFSGFVMFFKPEKAREIIGKAGSTYLINYTELGIRLIIGISFLMASLYSNYEMQFKIIGCFLIFSALILMCVPIKKHHQFSTNAAKMLKPIYLKICAPFSIFSGIILLIMINKSLDVINF